MTGEQVLWLLRLLLRPLVVRTGGPVLRLLRFFLLGWPLDRFRLLVGLGLPRQFRELVRLDLSPPLLVVRNMDQPDWFSLELELERVAVAVVDHPLDRRPLLEVAVLVQGVGWVVAEVVEGVVLAAAVVVVVHEVVVSAEVLALKVGCCRLPLQMSTVSFYKKAVH